MLEACDGAEIKLLISPAFVRALHIIIESFSRWSDRYQSCKAWSSSRLSAKFRTQGRSNISRIRLLPAMLVRTCYQLLRACISRRPILRSQAHQPGHRDVVALPGSHVLAYLTSSACRHLALRLVFSSCICIIPCLVLNTDFALLQTHPRLLL